MKKTVRTCTLFLALLLLFSVAMPAMAASSPYLSSSKEISFQQDDSVSTLAAELTSDKRTIEEKAMAIFSYIVTTFDYDWELADKIIRKEIRRYTPDPNVVLKKQKGICYDIASLYAAMCRSVGIPAKMLKGYVSNVSGYHAWNSVYDRERGEWISMDLTSDMCLKRSASSSWRKLRAEEIIIKTI